MVQLDLCLSSVDPTVHTHLISLHLQALQLVVVAVHAKALSLLYVDQLLEEVKQVAGLLALGACASLSIINQLTISFIKIDFFSLQVRLPAEYFCRSGGENTCSGTCR